MSDEEWIEFFRQSTESLHANLQEQASNIQKLNDTVEKLSAASARQDERLDKLITITERMVAKIGDHERRIGGLEGNSPA